MERDCLKPKEGAGLGEYLGRKEREEGKDGEEGEEEEEGKVVNCGL